ncbi:MAG: hypothetical protein V4598_01390 [Bdellovibrionota bacterium]
MKIIKTLLKISGLLVLCMGLIVAYAMFRYPPKDVAKVERFESEKTIDKDGKEIKTNRGYTNGGKLIQVTSYKDGYKYGEQLDMHEGELRKSSWYYDEKGGGYITIIYDSNDKVVSAVCTENFYNEEQEKVCGFKGPYTYSQDNFMGILEVTMNKGVRSIVRQFDFYWKMKIEEKNEVGKTSRSEYAEGVIQKEKVSFERSWYENRFNEKGLLKEKLAGKKESVTDEVTVFNKEGKEASYWLVAQNGKCSLQRSLASDAPKPSICP